MLLADLNAHCRPFLPLEGGSVEPLVYKMLAETFRSAYSEVLEDEPDFTCWGGFRDRDVRGVFDYIFLRGAQLRAIAALETPSASEVLEAPTRLPSPAHPTDHIEMVADLAVVAPQALFVPSARGRARTT